MASIYSIVYQPKDKTEEPPDRYNRIAVETANLIVEHGIEGDRKAGRNPQRNLNLLSLEWLMQLKPQGYKTEPGDFGEQIILSGLDVEKLAPGTRLQLGDDACVEITKLRTGCERLVTVQGRSIDGLGPIGAMAKVIQSGPIKIGDPVNVLGA
jgi:MOSC domain-containing protein YiiM